MVALDAVVLVLASVMQRGRNQVLDRVATAGARSVITSVGSPWKVRAAVKNARAEAMSRRCDTYTSITCPRWSTARYTYRHTPETLT